MGKKWREIFHESHFTEVSYFVLTEGRLVWNSMSDGGNKLA